MSVASALLAGTAVQAQQAPAAAPAAPVAPAAADSGATLEEVVVTAEKRTENLQNVPISIQAINQEKLEELHVTDFSDYAQALPTVSFQSAGPGSSHAYMRGVAANNNINHSGPSPSVGVYLDEIPITTIDGELDMHVYDIQRVEALSGPQGTLYGASSEAGTIRMITNKPNPDKFEASYDLGLDTLTKDGALGYVAEGMVNIPISSTEALRIVAWDEKKAGFISNVPGTITWPTSGIVESNAPFVKKDYNDVETYGGRAALKLVLSDTWTVTPSAMGQVQDGHGVYGYSPNVGDLQVQHYLPESSHDSWLQSMLTVEGKIWDLDVVYAGGYLTRNVHTTSDYTDYSFFYDKTYGSGTYYRDNNGNLINPDQEIIGRDNYTKNSQELRFTTPKDFWLRGVFGGFYERQVHEILQDYYIAGLADQTSAAQPTLSVTGWPNTWWLTDQERVDVDEALFGEMAADFGAGWTLTVGDRLFHAKNSLQGYYGFGQNNPFASGEGEATCQTPWVPFHGAPCQDLNGKTSASGNSPKVNLTWKIDPEHLVYLTFSKGFRPGGVNRAGGGTLPPYKPDYLTNYEAGWKTQWFNNRLRYNAAVFREDWKNFQFSFLGPNSLTIIQNAGQAQIMGWENELEFAVTHDFTLSGGFVLMDPKLKQNYCGEAFCPTPEADYNATLPITPKFKADLVARYTFDLLGGKGFVQADGSYVGSRLPDLRSGEWHDSLTTTGSCPTGQILSPVIGVNQYCASYAGSPQGILGTEQAYENINVSLGLEKDKFHYELFVTNVFDKRGQLDRYAECDAVKCGENNTYIVPTQPRTIGIKFGEKF